MYKLTAWFIRLFGLKGSWKWACKQMDKGYIVKRLSDTGQLKYKLDAEDQRRIQWAFTRTVECADWANAYIFLSDFESTDYIIHK